MTSIDIDLLADEVAEVKIHEPKDAEFSTELKMEWFERFDQHKLKYVVDHLEEFKGRIISTGHDFKEDNEKWQQQHTQLTRYLAASNNGVIAVKYHQTTPKFGRMFANRSQSLQNITRAVRHTIAGNLYDDIDIENAHPTILAHICSKAGIDCPYLTTYIQRRDEFLNKIMKDAGVDKGAAKQVILAIMNGGHADYERLAVKPKCLTAFKAECETIWTALIQRNYKGFCESKEARIQAGKNYNHEGSFANKMLCDMENKILAVIIGFFQREGIITDTCALCFDGVMVPKDPRVDYDIVLPACSAAIQRTLGISVTLKCKPMAEGLELPADIGQYTEPRYKYFSDHNQFAGIEVASDTLDKWIDSALVYVTGGGNALMYTKNWKNEPKSGALINYFEAVDPAKLKMTLGINVKVLNPYYNPMDARAAANSKDAAKPKGKSKKELGGDEQEVNTTSKYLEHHTLASYLAESIANRTLVVKNSIDFYPYLKRKHPHGVDLGDTFNVFTGFPMDDQIFDKPQTFEQSHLYRHMRDEMFNGDLGELNDFMAFAGDMIQRPAELRSVAHVFYTEQGCGKGMIVEWLKAVLGHEHVLVFANSNAYFQRFNADRANKILNVLEEVNERGDCYEKHGQLKADITNPTIRIEFKGGAITHMRAFARFIFNSNNENTLYVEHDDRRLTMHRSLSTRANDYDYFTPIWAEVRSPEFALMSFNYLAEYKYDVASVNKAYMTPYKREQQLANLSNPIKFLITCIENKWTGVSHEENRISSVALYSTYTSWCCNNHLKCFSNPAFMSELKHLRIHAPRTLTLYGQREQCLEIEEPVLLEALRKYLKNPDFQFQTAA